MGFVYVEDCEDLVERKNRVGCHAQGVGGNRIDSDSERKSWSNETVESLIRVHLTKHLMHTKYHYYTIHIAM